MVWLHFCPYVRRALVVGAPLGFAVAHLRGAVSRPFEHTKSQSGFLRLYRILKSRFVFSLEIIIKRQLFEFRRGIVQIKQNLNK